MDDKCSQLLDIIESNCQKAINMRKQINALTAEETASKPTETCFKKEKTISSMNIEIKDEEGNLIATFTGLAYRFPEGDPRNKVLPAL